MRILIVKGGYLVRFELVDNGVDSLKFGIEFYRKFMELEDIYDENNPGYLKMTIISIHNTIELFTKKLLINVNDLLIFDDELGNEALLKLFSEQLNQRAQGKKDIPIDWYLVFTNADVKTIGYRKCIDRLKSIYKLDQRYYDTLEELGGYRNKLTHFGLDKVLELTPVLLVINDSLELINTFFYQYLKDEENAYLKKLYEDDAIEDLLEEAKYLLDDYWCASFSGNFVKINNVMNELQEDSKFLTYWNSQGYNIDISLGKHIDSSDITLTLTNEEKDYSLSLSVYNIPRTNITLLIDWETALIYSFLDQLGMFLSDEDTPLSLYIYRKPLEYHDDLEVNTVYWDSIKKNGQCENKGFTKNSIKNILENIMRNV